MHRQDVLVDQVELAERGDERSPTNQPDVPRGAMAQFFYQRARVTRHELHVRVVATGRAAREHIGRLFAVGPFAEAEDLFIRAPTHYQRFYRVEERSITVVVIRKEPIDAAITLGDEAIEAGGDKQLDLWHALSSLLAGLLA